MNPFFAVVSLRGEDEITFYASCTPADLVPGVIDSVWSVYGDLAHMVYPAKKFRTQAEAAAFARECVPLLPEGCKAAVVSFGPGGCDLTIEEVINEHEG